MKIISKKSWKWAALLENSSTHEERNIVYKILDCKHQSEGSLGT